MKKSTILFITIFITILSGCSKKEIKQITEIKETEYMYVNSYEGLRIRSSASVIGKKIGYLKNKEKVEVLSREDNIEEIDGIKSNWINIKTEENLTGFVF